MSGVCPTLGYRCARRRALSLPKPDADSLLLASGSKKIGQNSPGGFSDGDRRWMSIRCLDRLSAVANPSKYPFRLSEGFLCRDDSEVLINISLRQLVGRDQIDPIIVAGEGGGGLRLCHPPSTLSFDHERSCLRSHSEARERSHGSGTALIYGWSHELSTAPLRNSAHFTQGEAHHLEWSRGTLPTHESADFSHPKTWVMPPTLNLRHSSDFTSQRAPARLGIAAVQQSGRPWPKGA